MLMHFGILYEMQLPCVAKKDSSQIEALKQTGHILKNKESDKMDIFLKNDVIAEKCVF